MSTAQVAAVDLGATSGRVMVADVGAGRLELTQVARFANDPVTVCDGNRESLHWNITGLYAEICAGLAEAARRSDNLVGIGIDSWAVDYGLLRNGALLGMPYHYRDGRSADGVAAVRARIGDAELYRRNGLQHLPFNTVYQLAAERNLDVAEGALLVPDLIGYWLTGVRATERTNASTTGLLRLDGRWDTDLCRTLGLPMGLFGEIVDPGTELGGVLPAAAARLGIGATAVTTVASHDTASAVVAVPMDPADSAYISCGTWGLVGVELGAPVVSERSRTANFTNEVGADGRIRFLHNVMGLWLLSETVRQFQREGYRADLAELLVQAAEVSSFDVFDVADPRFLPPGDMPGRIRDWYAERGLRIPFSRAELVRVVVESLAAAFAAGVRTAADLSGVPVRTVHMVGGGCQNRLLCQLTADRLGLDVLAGPVEATALGNVLIGARARGVVDGDLATLRALVADRFPPQRYSPRANNRHDRPQLAGTGKVYP